MLGCVIVALLAIPNLRANVFEYQDEYDIEDVDFEDHEYSEDALVRETQTNPDGRHSRLKRLGGQSSAARTLSQDEIREVKGAINELLAGRGLNLTNSQITEASTIDEINPNNEATKDLTFTGLTTIDTVGPKKLYEDVVEELLDSAKRQGFIQKSRNLRNRPKPRKTSLKPKLSRTSFKVTQRVINKYGNRKNLGISKISESNLHVGEIIKNSFYEDEPKASIIARMENIDFRGEEPDTGGIEEDEVVKDPTNAEYSSGIAANGEEEQDLGKTKENQSLSHARTEVDLEDIGREGDSVKETEATINTATNSVLFGDHDEAGTEVIDKKVIETEQSTEGGLKNNEGVTDSGQVTDSADFYANRAEINTKAEKKLDNEVGTQAIDKNVIESEQLAAVGNNNNEEVADSGLVTDSAVAHSNPAEINTNYKYLRYTGDRNGSLALWRESSINSTSVTTNVDAVVSTNRIKIINADLNNITTTLATTSRRKSKRRRTTTSTTPPPTTTTTPVPDFDIPALVEIISNLTHDLETNITDIFNQTLLKYKIPTCKTPTPSTTELIIHDLVNATVVAKCFVCGLETTGIPQDAHCADAFAGDFLPLVPVDQKARGKIARYRKYCRYMDVNGVYVNATQPRSLYGRFTGGCSVRWVDLTGVYTQRACRSTRRAMTGRHFASKRMAKLEMALKEVDNGCIISPMASLLPLSRGISLFARFHACVCTGSWCNVAPTSEQWFAYMLLCVCVLAQHIVSQ